MISDVAVNRDSVRQPELSLLKGGFRRLLGIVRKRRNTNEDDLMDLKIAIKRIDNLCDLPPILEVWTIRQS